jgi:N-acetylglucosaminyl-diphospho-decaprenol L-rhamnosyltransferase
MGECRGVEVTPAATIVVVTHRGPGSMLRTCLESLAASGVATSVVVVDNSGRPSSPADRYGPAVDDVLTVENRGFGAAANAGFRLALRRGAAPVGLLNDDIEVEPDWLGPLLSVLSSDDRLGAVQPMLVRHGTDRVNSLGVELDRFGAGSDIGLDRPIDAVGDGREIEIFTGGAVLFQPRFLRATGGFDERYFLYYEDVDLALRGAELGWRYRCEPASVVHHHGGVSTSSLGADVLRYQERNRLWVAARFGSIRMVAAALGLSFRRLRHGPRQVHATALALGIVGIPGALVRRRRARRPR